LFSSPQIGDQILEVNGQSFMNVTHDEAVNQFKFHKRMSLVVRDVGKVPHSCTTIEPEPWDVGRRKCPVSAMVEEKARSLLPRHQFSNLSFYIKEYGARGLTVEAFVSILLEMLDTPEKVSSVFKSRSSHQMPPFYRAAHAGHGDKGAHSARGSPALRRARVSPQ
jgi:whirlin